MAVAYRDVRVDLATQRAERAGHALPLTAKEHGLLVFFLRHPGQVLSRTRIYEHVWDERYDGLSNTLEVHVKELRRKLEAHGPRLDSHTAGTWLSAGRRAGRTAGGGVMSLATRLSGFFLAAVALALGGFSMTLYLLARSHFQRDLDERLVRCSTVLSAAADVDPGKVEWEPAARPMVERTARKETRSVGRSADGRSEGGG